MIVSALEAGIYRHLGSFPLWKLASIEIYGHFHRGSWHLKTLMVVSAVEVGMERLRRSFPPWRAICVFSLYRLDIQ